MAKKTQAQIEFEAKTSGFTSGIKSMDQSLGTLRKELKLNSTELKGNADDVDLLAQRKELLQKESQASAEKVELLTKKLNEAERLFGSSSNEVRLLNNQLLDAKNVFQGIQNEIAQTDNKLNNLENGLSNVSQDMKKADNSSDELTDGFTTMKGVVAELVADGIQQLSSSLQDLAVDSDTAYSSFQAQTGASTKEMKEFEGAIEEIYSNNFGESINDIANAMAEVKQQTKETDPSNLKKMTEHALTLRDTFDMDVKESMRAVNSLMNQFGLDSDEAFNLVVQGAQNGLNANDDLLDTINEYSVQFKNAGYSADDMLNMLYNGAETGTWSIDKLGDAVKEMNIRFSDGTVSDALKENKKALGLTSKEVNNLTNEFNKGGDSSKQAIGKVIESIMSVEDETERYKLGVSVFGTMWEDLGAETISSLMKTEGAIDSTKGSMEELTEVKYDNITSELAEIGRTIKTDVLIPVVEDLLPPLKEGLEWLKDNLNWLLPVITGIGVAIATYFVVSKIIGFIGVIKTIIGLVKTGTTVFGALNTVMALNPIALIVGAIVGLIAVFVLLWNKCDGFREFWINLWEGIKSVASTVWEAIKGFFSSAWEWIKGVWESAKTWFSDLWNGIKEGASNIWEGIKTVWSSFTTWINTNIIQPIIGFFRSLWEGIQAVWDGICNGVQVAWDFICNLVQVGIMLIGSIISGAVQIITLPFRFIWENCKEYVFQAWEWIKEKVSTAVNTVKTVITTVFNAIKNFFSTVWNGIKNIFTTVWNAIVGFITPIVNRIKSVITTVFNAIKSTMSKVVNTIKTTITTVFNAIKNTISTIFNAIKSVVTSVWNSIKSAITTVINAIKSVITSVFNAVKNTVSNIFNGIKNTVTNVWNNIKSKVSSVVNGVKNTIVNTFNNVKSRVTSIFNNVKTAITKPIESAKNKIKGIVDSIKGFFNNMKLKLPKIKLPHFKIDGKLSLNPPSVPKLKIDWYKDGGIFAQPTIFNTRNGLKGVGEAGAEAILPLQKLEDWMNSGFNRVTNNNYYNSEKIERLIEVAEAILEKPSDIYMDRTKVGSAMAETNDYFGGQRVNFRERGLVL